MYSIFVYSGMRSLLATLLVGETMKFIIFRIDNNVDVLILWKGFHYSIFDGD